MDAKERSAAWAVDQQDPDNWLEIPDFGINPIDVGFKGFMYPIVTPNDKGYQFGAASALAAVRQAHEGKQSQGFGKCAGKPFQTQHWRGLAGSLAANRFATINKLAN